jgi:hypothetical protein
MLVNRGRLDRSDMGRHPRDGGWPVFRVRRRTATPVRLLTRCQLFKGKPGCHRDKGIIRSRSSNTVTEMVHERTLKSAIENGGQVAASDSSDQIEQLRKENAELSRSLGLIKSAAALLAAALDRQ